MLGMEDYSINEFASKMELSAEYIRQACREHVDSYGRKAKLPFGYRAKKLGSNWRIVRKKPLLTQMPFPVEGLPFKKIDFNYVDLIVLKNEMQHPIYLLNLFDFYGPLVNEPGVYYDVTSDYLLYLVFNKLKSKISKGTNDHNRCNKRARKIFLAHVDIMSNWFVESGKPLYFNKHLHNKLTNLCLHCCKPLTISAPDKYHFCNIDHYKNFYSRRQNSVLSQLAELESTNSIDEKIILSTDLKSDITYSEESDFHSRIESVANTMTRRILSEKNQTSGDSVHSSLPVMESFSEILKEAEPEILNEIKGFKSSCRFINERIQEDIVELIESLLLKQLKKNQALAVRKSPIYRRLLWNYLQVASV